MSRSTRGLKVGQLTETVRVTEAPVTVQFNKTTLDPQVTFTSTSPEQSPFHHWAGSRLDVGGGTAVEERHPD